jgi:hypothetical protein
MAVSSVYGLFLSWAVMNLGGKVNQIAMIFLWSFIAYTLVIQGSAKPPATDDQFEEVIEKCAKK